MGSIAGIGTRKKIDASALNEVSIAYGSRRHRGVTVLMPVGPCTVPALVIDELKQVSWYPHLPRANARALGNAGCVYRSSDDVDMGIALYPTLDKDEICATIEIKINYFKPVATGKITCTTELVNRGKTVANLESRVFSGDTLVAQANGNYSIFTPRKDKT